MKRSLFPVAVLISCCSLAWADQVVLTNGNEFEGEIVEDSKRQVRIKVRGGVLTFPRHLVKSVKKDAPKPKPKPRAPRKETGPLDYGPDPNHWRDFHERVHAGEVWVFDRRDPPMGGTPSKAGFVQIGARYEVERLGLDGIEVKHWPLIRDPKKFPGLTLHTPSIWSQDRPSLRDRRSPAPEKAPGHDKILKRLAAAKTVTLELAGRSWPCKILRDGGRKANSWAWMHYADGRIQFPGALKAQYGRHTVLKLVRIEPAPKDQPQPPRDPGARVGDQLVFKRYDIAGGSENTFTVVRMCPSEVLMQRRATLSTGKLTRAFSERWTWNPALLRGLKGKTTRAREITIAGRQLRCVDQIYERKSASLVELRRDRYVVDERGVPTFPGIVEQAQAPVKNGRPGKWKVKRVLTSWTSR